MRIRRGASGESLDARSPHARGEPLLEPRHVLSAAKPAREADGVGERFLGIAVERGGAARRAGIVHLVIPSLGKCLEAAQMYFIRHCHAGFVPITETVPDYPVVCWRAFMSDNPLALQILVLCCLMIRNTSSDTA